MGAIDKFLKITILGDATHAKEMYSELKKEGQQFGKEVEKHGVSLKTVGTVMTAVGGTIVGTMAAAVVAVAKTAGQIDDLAQAAGVGVEQFQKLAYAAHYSGVEQENLSGNFVKLEKSMASAKTGTGDVAEAFAKMKISATDTHGKLRNVDEVLPEIADHFQGMTNSTEKTNLAITLFGKSGAEMVQFLSKGSESMRAYAEEAEKLGIILSQETVNNLGDFEDTLDAVKSGIGAGAKEIAADLVPGLQVVANGLKSGLELLNSIPGPVKQVIVVGTALGGTLALVGGIIMTMVVPALAAVTAPMWVVIGVAAALAAAAVPIVKNWDYVASAFMMVWDKIVAATDIAVSSIKAYVLTGIDLILKGLNTISGFIPGWGDKLKKAMSTVEKQLQSEVGSIQNNYHKLTENSYRQHLEQMQSRHKKATTEMTEEERAFYNTLTEDQKAAYEKMSSTQRAAYEKQILQQRAYRQQANEEALKLEKEWHNKFLDETQSSLEKLNREEKEALNQENLTEKAKTNIKEYYFQKRLQLEQEEADKRAQILQSANAVYEEVLSEHLNAVVSDEEQSVDDRIAALSRLFDIQKEQYNREFNRQMSEATGNQDAQENLQNAHDLKMLQMETEYQNKVFAIDQKAANKLQRDQQRNLRRQLNDIADVVDAISNVYTQYYQDKEYQLENWYNSQKETIENTVTDETAKNAALEALDEEYNQKKNAIAREQAEKAKTAAIFDAIIKTALAVMQAFAAYAPPVSFIMGAAAAAAGALQVKAIQDQPLPELAEGGITTGPTKFIAGEGDYDEVILPLSDEKLAKIGAQMYNATNNMDNSSSTNNSTINNITNVNIGNYIGDDPSLKKFVRKITDMQISEDKRKGK